VSCIFLSVYFLRKAGMRVTTGTVNCIASVVHGEFICSSALRIQTHDFTQAGVTSKDILAELDGLVQVLMTHRHSMMGYSLNRHR